MAEIADTYMVAENNEMQRKGGSSRSRFDSAKRLPVSSAKKKHNRYPLSDKLRAVAMSENGMGSIAIGKEMGIDSSLIRVWIRKYREYGIDGLKPASYGKNVPVIVMPKGGEGKQDGKSKDSKRGFVRYVDNPALMRSMIGRLSSYGIRYEDIKVWDNFNDYLKTVEKGETVVVNSLFDISTDISSLITIINTLFNNNITVISLEDNGTVLLSDGTELGTLLRVLHNYVKVASTDTVPSFERVATPIKDEPAMETVSFDQRFAKAYEIWCNGGTMAYAARASGCSYYSFRRWIKKGLKHRQ